MRTESKVLAQFDEWAQKNELIRAALLTGSRVNPNSPPDFLSDYDISIYTRGVWDLGVNVRPIYFMARRNDE